MKNDELRNCKISVCDDCEVMRKITISLFELIGCKNIVEFSDGSELLDFIKENYSKFDLITIDYDMPLINGFETSCRIMEHNPEQFIAMVTSYELSESELSVLNDYQIPVIKKPITLSKIKEIRDFI